MKESNKPKKSALDRFKYYYENSYPKKYISPTAGEQAPWYLRAFSAAIYHTSNFVSDTIVAVKSIIREVM